MVASGGSDPRVSTAQLVSHRAFSGPWEYHLDTALYTSPARDDHSGAALINMRGELIGIGSLLVSDARGAGDAPGSMSGATQAGNVFVPVDLLKPILTEMRAKGHSTASLRPWLGAQCVELRGQVRVSRVQDDSPAEVAGLQTGDRIVRIDGQPVDDLASLWKQLWRGQAERAVRLDIERDDQPTHVTVWTVDRMKTLRRPAGI